MYIFYRFYRLLCREFIIRISTYVFSVQNCQQTDEIIRKRFFAESIFNYCIKSLVLFRRERIHHQSHLVPLLRHILFPEYLLLFTTYIVIMSLEGISTAVMEALQVELVQKVKDLIPEIFKQLTPQIAGLVKSEIAQYIGANDITDLIKKTIRESLTKPEEELDNFMESFGHIMDSKRKQRDNEFYKLARNKKDLQLYNECMIQEPLYIPREFRHDKYHVMSQKELDIITKVELKRFQAECEILVGRNEELQKRCTILDNEVLDIISMSNMSEKASVYLINRWKFMVDKDEKRVAEQMAKKVESTRLAYQKDRMQLQQHKQQRIRKINNSSSSKRSQVANSAPTSLPSTSISDELATSSDSPGKPQSTLSTVNADANNIHPQPCSSTDYVHNSSTTTEDQAPTSEIDVGSLPAPQSLLHPSSEPSSKNLNIQANNHQPRVTRLSQRSSTSQIGN